MTATTVSRLAIAGLALVAVTGLLAGCSPPSQSTSPSASDTPKPTATPAPDPIAGLTLQQRVGQIFMVGTTATAAQPVTLAAISDLHVGNVFLSGRSYGGAAGTAAVVSRLTSLVGASTTAGLPLLVATDQEGGEVQVLHGPGFSTMPTGLAQGAMTPPTLGSNAATWGSQLAAAGVNMDLAPVVDLVASPATAATNPPIGGFFREFGYDAPTIVAHANAFRQGMSSAGVLTVIKHFPGLGAVSANTDTASGVTDTTTTSSSPSVGIYRSEIAAGATCIMVSSADYSQIDPGHPAVFSPTVVTGLLRNQLGFKGVIITDDLSGATQVLAWSPANRAILAIEAGVDIVLVSKDPAVAAQMVDAVAAKAEADPAFATLVDNAARRVIALKGSL